jgi:hypothetical protein
MIGHLQSETLLLPFLFKKPRKMFPAGLGKGMFFISAGSGGHR